MGALPISSFSVVFFFNDTATTEIYTLSLHDALPISVECWVSVTYFILRNTLLLFMVRRVNLLGLPTYVVKATKAIWLTVQVYVGVCSLGLRTTAMELDSSVQGTKVTKEYLVCVVCKLTVK